MIGEKGNSREFYKKLVRDISATGVAIFAVIEISNFFLKDYLPTGFFTGITRFGIFITMTLLVGLIIFSLNLLKQVRVLEEENLSGAIKTDDSLIAILENAYKKKNWNEIVKIGRQLSEPLWYTGKFKVRIKIGKLVEVAAGVNQLYDDQAEVLIDDLGWTNFRINNEEEAKRNIKRGLKIAEQNGNNYLIAKAYRHFSDISRQNGNLEKAKSEYDVATEYLDQIEDNKKKVEMEGNLKYTLSKYYMTKKDYRSSLIEIENAMKCYQQLSDDDRLVKMFNLKGRILLLTGEEGIAMDTFQKGLTFAEKISNNVHIVSNTISLAECYINSEDLESAQKMINWAREYVSMMHDPRLVEKLKNVESNLSNRMKTLTRG